MIWTDGQGRDWQIDAAPHRITIRSGDDVLRLERADWNRDLYVGVLDHGVVIRFQGPDFEVGFLVLPAAAREFFGKTLALSRHVRDELMQAIKKGEAPADAFKQIRILDDNIKIVAAFMRQEKL